MIGDLLVFTSTSTPRVLIFVVDRSLQLCVCAVPICVIVFQLGKQADTHKKTLTDLPACVERAARAAPVGHHELLHRRRQPDRNDR